MLHFAKVLAELIMQVTHLYKEDHKVEDTRFAKETRLPSSPESTPCLFSKVCSLDQLLKRTASLFPFQLITRVLHFAALCSFLV